MSTQLLSAVLIAGIVAGTLDIFAAALINRTDPVAILRVIASGVAGARALTGGAAVAVQGFVLQLAMGVLIAAIYGVTSLWLPFLTTIWIPAGVAYGLGVYLVMTFIVVPLSAAPKRPLPPELAKIGKDLVAMIGFALIIAYAVHRASF